MQELISKRSAPAVRIATLYISNKRYTSKSDLVYPDYTPMYSTRIVA